ncbi:uncharacterized protein L3040_009514 [Drepanopeziza brunnea f. sp. 'multigermtubi']|nr:hypothetical protein L3040_009514 [Drepanopeziza brunnea f. sp. 'multigermtubi']
MPMNTEPDANMLGGIDADPDFEFFNSNLENSPGLFFAEDLVTDNSQFLPNFGTPDTVDQKSQLLPVQNSLLETTPQPSRSAPQPMSPAAVFQDTSAAFSGSKRKSRSSSDSSGSALTSADDVMMADADMVDWKFEEGTVSHDAKIYSGFDGTINPAAMGNFDFIDKAMEKVFDFDSAASSPSPFAMGPVDSPEMASGQEDRPRRRQSPMLKSKSTHHSKRNSQHSITQSMNGLTTAGSREASPPAMVTRSQESSPAAFFNNSPSPGNTVNFMNAPHMTSGPIQHPGWAAGLGGFNNGPSATMQRALNPHPMPEMSLYQPPAHMAPPPLEPLLTIHPTPLKSRVETQIPITMVISNVPAGVTKVHLPTHCISKPKLLAKPTPARSPDTLELDVKLVLSSAMANPENRRRAFERAASGRAPSVQVESSPGESGADEDDENKPSNGGDVDICPGCITRERKRAARKKVKKVEEEESWHRDEAKRVIVFNTHEVKEWQAPTSQQPLAEATGNRPEPFFAEGSMQVDIPMRIACYCRHQNEKVGFQVIFTLKDYQGRVIAQTITSSIMITDDHKTHNMPQMANESDGQMFSGPGPFSADPPFDLSAAPPGNLPPFRLSQSNPDSQGMQSNFHMQFPPPLPPGVAPSSHVSQANSVSATPRNMSRPTSPSLPHGRTAKKRKPSGSNKVPSGLVMTRLETGDIAVGQGPPTGPSSANTSSAPSPFTPNFSTFTLTDQQHYHPQPPTTISTIPRQYHTGPPTPNGHEQAFFSNGNRSQSMENLAMHQLYSTPASAHPSRVPSPSNGMRGTVQAYQNHQARIAQAVANGLSGVPLALNPRRPPTIHKLVPQEGPKSGGIEVTCLGSGFCAGLEVMFGDSIATTTTFWGDTTLVCLLPPAERAGTVAVTFKHQHPQHQEQQIHPYAAPPMPKQNVFFKYVDDDEQQMLRIALSVLDHKMAGKMEDVRDLARRILGDGPSSWCGPNGPSLPGCGGGGGFMGPLN